MPSKTLSEISRILSVYKDSVESPQSIEITISDNQIVFSYDNVELISRLIEGQYPDYKQIIPKTKITVNSEQLTKSVKTNSLFSQSGIFDISLEFEPEEKIIKVSSTNISVGENVSSIEVDFDGIKNSIVVNYRYLLDGLQNTHSDDLLIELLDSNTPCVIKPKDDPDFLYIIMPIKQ